MHAPRTPHTPLTRLGDAEESMEDGEESMEMGEQKETGEEMKESTTGNFLESYSTANLGGEVEDEVLAHPQR